MRFRDLFAPPRLEDHDIFPKLRDNQESIKASIRLIRKDLVEIMADLADGERWYTPTEREALRNSMISRIFHITSALEDIL